MEVIEDDEVIWKTCERLPHEQLSLCTSQEVTALSRSVDYLGNITAPPTDEGAEPHYRRQQPDRAERLRRMRQSPNRVSAKEHARKERCNQQH